MNFPRQSTLWVLLVIAPLSAPAWAAVQLRVEARPVSDPIEVFATVTDPFGDPVPNLATADFTVTIDGQAVTLAPGSVTLPSSQDPSQKVSVIFAMDFSPSVTQIAVDALRTAVISFIDQMNDGDFAAILKFNGTLGATVIQPFVAIDHAVNSDLLFDAVNADYPGENTNIYDAVSVALQHFAAPPAALPPGPKALILVSDGGENASTVTEAEAIALANDNSIPVFTIGVGSLDAPRRVEILTDLAIETSGEFIPAPTDADIIAAYAAISELLSNEYLITIASGITDCAEHTIEVTVTNQAPASATFSRRDCDVTPDAFSFASQTGVETGANVTSNAVTITGIEADVPISVSNGRYSIGCTDTFTGANGTIANGQTVCLRHTAATTFSTTQVTMLTVGGVSANFASTTQAEPRQGGGGGGGGVTGLLELLLGLSLLLARRAAQA